MKAFGRYDDAIMMARTQVTLTSETHRRARRRAAEIGISLAEYLRRLVERDLGEPRTSPNPSIVFDLGASSGSNIARNKDATGPNRATPPPRRCFLKASR